MATSKLLKPTNVTISIPEFTDQPDQRVNSNCIDKEADAINALNDQIANMATAKVTGTMASSTDTYVSASYPTGFNGSNCVIIGNTVKVASGQWYSNNPSITCMADTNNGIRIKCSENNFINQPFVVMLMKIPS